MLAPGWGDGSGKGTGGTVMVASAPYSRWMGVWSPHLFSFSSNWKELRTMCQMMEDIVEHTPDVVRGMTLFYFTDNSTVYCAVNKGASAATELQKLIVRIKLAELRLGCLLESIYVPGVVMILEGTDGLSRGVWVSPLRQAADRVLMCSTQPLTVPRWSLGFSTKQANRRPHPSPIGLGTDVGLRALCCTKQLRGAHLRRSPAK